MEYILVNDGHINGDKCVIYKLRVTGMRNVLKCIDKYVKL